MPQNNLLMDKPFSRSYPKPRDQKTKLRQLIASEDTYATTLLVLFVDRYGMEGMEWHPETIRLQLEEDFAIDLPKHAMDKLMAAIAIVTSDAFFKDVRKFIELSNILAGDDFDPTVFEPADSAEMAWAVAEAILLFPPDEAMPFSDEIRGYVGHVLREEGYIRPPKVMHFATDADFADQVEYDFQDDPEMFAAIHKNQSSKADEIDVLVASNLQELFGQLSSLQLKTGSTDQIKDRIKAGLA